MRDNLEPLRHIEGFPLGEDEDLHALSDSPHYTAYPNPHLAEFIEKYGTPYDEATDDYHREPYVADVSEGKSGPVYTAHSYHTKVPYKAIIPFIEHYTEPGDIIFDGFCGTGMTGVATQITKRRAVLSDLSPVATFIAYNYNNPINLTAFKREAKRILEEVQAECGWMYETHHTDGQTAQINYTVWSEVFLCPYCDGEIIFWKVAVDHSSGKVKKSFPCPNCNASLKKRELRRVTNTVYDDVIRTTIESVLRVPVLINYTIGRKTLEKRPDADDLALINSIEASEIPYWYPTLPMMLKGSNWGDSWRAGYHTGITHVHHFFTKRAIWTLGAAFDRLGSAPNEVRSALKFTFEQAVLGMSKIARYVPTHYSQVNQYLSGTLYVGSQIVDVSLPYILSGKISRLPRLFELTSRFQSSGFIVSTQSATHFLNLPENSIDYIFTDPPFGDNLMYSELNFLWEAWLKVLTNNSPEAIINNNQDKNLTVYRSLMTVAFSEMYRALKPGRWITVVFHNSRASVWNAIQEALAHAGFLVAQVTVMDKQQSSYKQIVSPSAVKNDLVINAYKPRESFAQRFTSRSGRDLEADFVRQHLEQLPIAANVERSKEMLYSKYLAYYVQHGYQVAYNGEQFYRALPQWGLVEEDGYWFSDESQLEGYHQALAAAEQEAIPQPPLFVFDERSAIQWLKHFLHHNPSTLSDIQPDYLKALQTSTDLIPDLRELLAENFGQPDRQGRYHWPNPQLQTELDEARHNRLLRLYNDYLSQAQTGQRLKEVRKEALVTGFTEAYREGRFHDILTVGHKLHKRLLEENPDLFDFVDIAEAKVEG